MSQRYEAQATDASPLGQPLHFPFSNRTAPNRFMKAAMTERLASWDPENFEARGIPSKELVNMYRRWGEGLYGVILTGNVLITYDHIEAPGNMIVPLDAPFSGPRFEAYKELASAGKAHGSLMVPQINHPGRQTEDRLQKHPVSASDIQLTGSMLGMTFAKPHAATQDEIDDIVNRFAYCAEYLHKAGFDGIELHGAHGYLLAQFLSQTTNKRTDKYGGSLRNRARIIIEVADAIRKRVPASSGFVLGIKVNSVEFQESGFQPEEAKELVHLLEDHSFDFVELSGGTYESLAFKHKRESSRKRESFFLEFADQIVPALTKTKAYVTGGFKTVDGMVKALDIVDGVGLGRPAAGEFYFPKDILDGKINSAIEPKLDPDDFGIQNVVAGTQMRQVGRDREPIDMSKQENVDFFFKDMGTWREKMSQDAAKMNMYGFVDLDSYSSKPFGTAST